MESVLDKFNDQATGMDQELQMNTERTDGETTNTTSFQSRSSSTHHRPHLREDDVDIFDGYSFKGRHSVLIDDEEEGSDEGSDRSIEEGEGVKPGTPEARPAAILPPVEDPATAPLEPGGIEEVPQLEEVETEEPIAPFAQPKSEQSAAGTVAAQETAIPAKVVTSTRQLANNCLPRPRREYSGLPALDRYLPDPNDGDTGVAQTWRDLADRWDFIETPDGGDDWDIIMAADSGDRNVTKGMSLFARGVVDRYHLTVSRRASTPNSKPRYVYAISAASGIATESAEHPLPPQRSVQTSLTFRKHPR